MALNSRLSWVAGIALLAFFFANATQAATRLYSGSLIIKSFGNDISTGTVPPYTNPYMTGIPLTGNCNTEPFHAQETLMFSHTPASGGPVTFTVPSYGGQVPALDTNGDTVPDVPIGCGGPTLSAGDPLTGSGALLTSGSSGNSCTPGPCTNPRKFTLPQSRLNKVKSDASAKRYTKYLWENHFADLHNDEAVFTKDGGDGNFGPIQFNAAKQKRKVVQSAGANKFGGVMRLLGSYGDNEGYFYNNATTSVYYYNWLFHYLGIGGQGTDGGGVVTTAFHETAVVYGNTRDSGYQTTSTVYASLFKWTTGTVTVTATGNFKTLIKRNGYDKRNATGQGAVQMVSPMLTKWVGAGTSVTAAIGIMKLNFVPEPSEWMMLASGVSMLGLMAHRRRSRRS
jgi:hypothetical protein